MPSFTKVAKEKAPRPAAKSNNAIAKAQRMYEEFVLEVKDNECGKLVIDENENERGIRLRLARAGKRVNRNVTAWQDEKDERIIWFEVAPLNE